MTRCHWCQQPCRNGAVSDTTTRRTFCRQAHLDAHRRELHNQRTPARGLTRLGYARVRR